MELLSHIIAMFLDPVGCGIRKSNGKASKALEKNELGEERELVLHFCHAQEQRLLLYSGFYEL